VLSDRCLSVLSVYLSVTLVYCGQTIGWIRMPLGTEIDLGLGHTVLDGDPFLPTGHSSSPLFDPCLLWPNDWVHQNNIWYGGRPRPRRHCVRRRPSSPRERGTEAPPHFSAHVYCAQTAGWIRIPLGTEVGLGSGDIVLDWNPDLPTERDNSSPHFWLTLLLHGHPSQQVLSCCSVCAHRRTVW